MKAEAGTTGVALISMLQIGAILFGACVSHFASGGHGMQAPAHPPLIIGFMRGFGCLVLMGLTITWATTTLWLRVRPGTTDAARVTAQRAGLVFLGIVVWMDMALLVMI
jgi:hypothetical protein